MKSHSPLRVLLLATLTAAVAHVGVAQTVETKISPAFAGQLAPILKELGELKLRQSYTTTTQAALSSLSSMAKSEAEMQEATFLKEDMKMFLEGKLATSKDVLVRKQCATDLATQAKSFKYDKTKSKACTQVTNAVYE